MDADEYGIGIEFGFGEDHLCIHVHIEGNPDDRPELDDAVLDRRIREALLTVLRGDR